MGAALSNPMTKSRLENLAILWCKAHDTMLIRLDGV